jgi:LCP family protein required for cell wall assembly
MYVEVPGHGTTKLTHACAYEGPQLTVDTIEMNFGVKIDGYAKIGYGLFVELVDGIGGITVEEIDSTESWALEKEGVYIDPGTNVHLNGIEALHYCRIRKGQSDFYRTGRQREALTLIIKKALKTNPLTLLKLGKSLASQVECSIGKAEMIALALKALPCVWGEIKQQQIPADGTWDGGTRDGMSVLLVDTDANRQVLKSFIY